MMIRLWYVKHPLRYIQNRYHVAPTDISKESKLLQSIDGILQYAHAQNTDYVSEKMDDSLENVRGILAGFRFASSLVGCYLGVGSVAHCED